MSLRRQSLNTARAFTLIEMLVVLTIIGILTALAIPAVKGTMRAYQLNATGQLVINQLNLARQSALSSSHVVQVRFYLLPDYNQAPGATPAVYRAMQCLTEGDPIAGGNPPLTAITKPVFFPAPVIISTTASPNVSPLISASPISSTSLDPLLPTYSNYQYSTFRFKPDGSTDLASGLNCLTLVLESDKSAANGLPGNYETIQVDPAIGTVRRFLP